MLSATLRRATRLARAPRLARGMAEEAATATGGATPKEYFVSGGFASIDANSVLNISALEAVPVEDLDADAVKVGLAQYTDAAASAKDDVEKAEAEIGVEVYSAMSFAITKA